MMTILKVEAELSALDKRKTELRRTKRVLEFIEMVESGEISEISLAPRVDGDDDIRLRVGLVKGAATVNLSIKETCSAEKPAGTVERVLNLLANDLRARLEAGELGDIDLR